MDRLVSSLVLIGAIVGAAFGTGAHRAAAAPRRPVWAAPVVDVEAWRLPQAASRTATPRIVLPATAAALETATAEAVLTMEAGGGGAEATGVPGAAGSTPGSTGGVGGEADGSALGPDATVEIGPPALPAAQEGGAALGSGRTAEAAASAAEGTVGAVEGESGASAEAGSSAADGPRGLIGPPADDKGIARVWATAGPPWAGTPLVDRFTRGRPAPLSWWPTYLVLLTAFTAAVVALWRRLSVGDASGRSSLPDHDSGGAERTKGGGDEARQV